LSLWDDFVKSGTNAVARFGSGVAKGIGFGPSATLPFAQSQVSKVATQAGMTPEAAAANTKAAFGQVGLEDTESVGVGTLTTLDKYVYQPVYEGLGAASLAVNPDTYRQGKSVEDSLAGAWDARKDISLGQSVADLFAENASLAPDWGPLAELNKVDIDIYDQEMRERIYLRKYDENGNRIDSYGNKIADASWIENVWRVYSGAIDLTKQLVADPLVIGGKAIKTARLSKLNKFSPEAIVDTKVWNAEQKAFADTTNTIRKNKLALADEEPELQRAKEFLDESVAGRTFDDTLRSEVNVIRESKGMPILDETLDRQAFVDDYKKYVDNLEAQVLKKKVEIDELSEIGSPKPILAAGVSDLIEQIVTRQLSGPEIAAYQILEDYAVDTPFLANALAQAAKRGEAAVTDVFLLATAADPASYIRLKSQHDDLLTLIDYTQTRIDDIETQVQMSLNAGDPKNVEKLNNQKKRFSEYLAAMRADDDYLDLLTRTEDSIIGTIPGLPVSSSKRISPFIEEYRASKAIVRAGLRDGSIRTKRGATPNDQFNWSRVKKSPLHIPTYVAQWVGYKVGLEKPLGMVTIKGLDYYDGVKEFQLILDDIPVLDNLVIEKRALMDEFVNAKDSVGRHAVLDKADKAVIDETFKKYEVADDVVLDDKGNEVLLSEVIYKAFVQKRALAVEAFQRDKAFGTDTNDALMTSPVVSSQLDYAVPMIDYAAFDSFVADYLKAGTTREIFKRELKMIKDEWIIPPYALVDKLWRADVLIRLGYTQRNLLGELTVLSMYDTGLSGMYSIGKVTESVGRFATNRWSHMLDIRDRYQAAVNMAEEKGSSVTRAKIRQVTPKPMPWSEYEQYAGDILQNLRDQKQEMINFADEIMQDPDAAFVAYPTESIAELDRRILIEEQKLATVAARVEAKGTRFGSQNVQGKQTVYVGPYEFAGVYEGVQGAAVQRMASSGGRTAFDMSPFTSMLKEMGLDGSGVFSDIAPTADSYFITLAKIANQQIQGSPTAMKVIAGETDEQILAYLRSSEGQRELNKLGWDQDLLPPAEVAAKSRVPGRPVEESLEMAGVPKTVKFADGKKVTVSSREPIVERFKTLTPQESAENYLQFVRYQVVERLFPSNEMKTLVREKLVPDELGRTKGTITSADLRIAAKDTELNPIAGEILEDSSIWKNPKMTRAEKLSALVFEVAFRKAFRVLGEYPEDAVITHPFASAAYKSKLDEIVQVWQANDVTVTNFDIMQAQTVARKWAVKQTREYLYRVVRKNGLAASIPAIAPFAQAQISTFRRVGKLSYRNPDKAARTIFAWNQLNTNSYQDEDGQRWFIWRIPPLWYDDKGISSAMPESLRGALQNQNEWRWNVNSFNILLAGLRVPTPDVLPGKEETTAEKTSRWATAAGSVLGIGPLIQMPANAILKSNPSINQGIYERTGIPLPAREIIEVFGSPYPSENWYDPILSGWNKRVQSLVMGEGNNDYERTQLVMFQNHKDRQRLGEESLYSNEPAKNDEELWKLAGEEASAFISLRLVSNLTLGFIPTYEGPMSAYVDLYRSYQTKYGVKAFDKWLEHYPDMGYIAVSRSKNLAGSSASTDAVNVRKKHNGMIEEAIKSVGLNREDSLAIVQMVTNNNVGAEVLRDPQASYWQKSKGDRISISAEEGYDNLKVREGWAWFMDQQETFNRNLEEAGVSRYSNAATKANEEKRKRIREYGATNPEWYEKYSVQSSAQGTVGFVRAMKVVISNEKFMKELPEDSYWFGIEAIITERDKLVNAMVENGKSTPGTRNLERYDKNIAPYLQDPTVEYYYNKFLDNDNFLLANPGSE
jgi:hypothetical protein